MFTGIRLAINKIKYRKLNGHNETFAANLFDHKRVHVGNHSYGGVFCLNHNDTAVLNIGNYVSIGPDVTFIPASDHDTGTVSTFPYKTKIVSGETEALSKGDITVEDDVWIGYGSMILSGVTIGQGAVIAAGSVITKDIPPYSVSAGVPAKVIRYRFDSDVIDFLLTLDYSKLSEETVRAHIDELYTKIGTMSIEDVKRTFEWFPKKNK